VYIYPDIPQEMPIHWNSRGAVDGYLGKPFGVALLLSIPVFLFSIFKMLPLISPQGFRMEKFQHVTDILILGLTVILSGLGALVLLAAAGQANLMGTMPALLSGCLLVVIGGCISRTTKNFFIGIRTPWTLASDAVWESTHRIGGRLFLLAGMATLATVVNTSWSIPVLLFTVGATVISCVAYSFFLYRKLYGFKNEQK